MNRYSESQTKSAYRSPVYNVRAVPVEKVVANSYNPNVVAPPEMKLLELSIWEDGYTMPCVCYYDAERDRYELVDGYHRYLGLKTSKRIYERERGLLPVAVIEKDLSNRMASTIRHNRARGTHNVELMSEIVGRALAYRRAFRTAGGAGNRRRGAAFLRERSRRTHQCPRFRVAAHQSEQLCEPLSR